VRPDPAGQEPHRDDLSTLVVMSVLRPPGPPRYRPYSVGDVGSVDQRIPEFGH